MANSYNAYTLCAELVAIQRRDTNDGRETSGSGVLEELCASTAVLWSDFPLAAGDEVSLRHRLGNLPATVCSCKPQSDGFLSELSIADSLYLPKHALVIARAA
ncbi:MAG TPA: hypothetical protein VFQ91_22980 [Bryobacteraceae bacterium]|nr:hypothetical protein [Bryobacteraceae bacterium]